MTPEEYAKSHQKAFRIAFDFLNAHFPPSEDEEWWKQTAKECADASVASGETTIVIELLTAIMNYLGKEYKRRYQDGKVDD
jgi:hypothetical protein